MSSNTLSAKTSPLKTMMRRFAYLSFMACLVFLIAPSQAAAGNAPEGPFSLEAVVKMALKHSYANKAKSFELEEAKHKSSAALSRMLPRLQANYSYTALDKQTYSSGSGRAIPTSGTDIYRWDLTIIQPLFTGLALKSNLDIADITVKVREQEKLQSDLDVIRDAKTAFYNVHLAQKILMVAQQTVTALTAQEADSSKFFERGLIPRNDLLRSQVALANATQEKERLLSQVRLSKSRLNLLIGRPSISPLTLNAPEMKPPLKLELNPLVETALKSRPVVKATKYGINSLEKAVVAAHSAYYPQVSAFARYMQDGDNMAADHNDFSNQYNSAVGIKVQWDIFEWGKTKSEVSGRRAVLRAAKERLKLLEDSVRLEVERNYQDLLVAEKNTRTAETALSQAKENQRITKLRYQQMVATSTDVLNAQTDLTQADTNYYLALYNYLTSLAELQRSVGGAKLMPSE